MARAKNPAYKRAFSITKNNSAYYFSHVIIRPHIAAALGIEWSGRVKPRLPRMLDWRQHQLARSMATATQMAKRALEIELYVEKRLKAAYAEHERLKGEKPGAVPDSPGYAARPAPSAAPGSPPGGGAVNLSRAAFACLTRKWRWVRFANCLVFTAFERLVLLVTLRPPFGSGVVAPD
jgi:hypothetical protein